MIEDESAPYDMGIHSNSSALAWTKFFREHNPECNLDDNVMLGWFANAMMAMHYHIYHSIQPEQTEQEPVAWKVIDGTNGEFMFSRVKPMERTYKYDVVIPLYTSPPKREPLGEEESYHEAKRLYEAEDGLWYGDGFVDGLKFAEKMHGIGGGE